MNPMRSSREGEMLLLDSVSHSRKLESSLKNKNLDLDLRERERGAQIFDLKESFAYMSAQQPMGVGGGLFILPTSKRVIGERTGLVQWNSLEPGLGLDLAGPPD
jgi:hypothetical protein